MTSSSESREEAVICEFLDCYLADRDYGRVRPPADYVAMFPDHERAIRREYALMAGLAPGTPPLPKRETDAVSIGRYRVLERLGSGAQGVVYLALDPELGRRVALKVLNVRFVDSDAARKRFRREAESAARLDDPGICTVLEIGEADAMPFIAMRYVPGEPLSSVIKRSRGISSDGVSYLDLEKGVDDKAAPKATSNSTVPRPPELPSERAKIQRILLLVEQVARSLHVAHEAGLVHRDMKPGNVMVRSDGSPVILDFGLVRDEDDTSSLTEIGNLLGAPAYMSPEQVTAQHIRLDRRSDIYSLGVMLYECLTLRRPFQGHTRDALLQAIVSKGYPAPRTVNPAISRDIEVVLETALAKDRDHRYQSALVLAEELERAREDRPIVARPISAPRRAWRWAKRNRRVAALMAGILLLVAATATLSGFLGGARHEAATQRNRADRLEAVREALSMCEALLDLHATPPDESKEVGTIDAYRDELARAGFDLTRVDAIVDRFGEFETKTRATPAEHAPRVLREALYDLAQRLDAADYSRAAETSTSPEWAVDAHRSRWRRQRRERPELAQTWAAVVGALALIDDLPSRRDIWRDAMGFYRERRYDLSERLIADVANDDRSAEDDVWFARLLLGTGLIACPFESLVDLVGRIEKSLEVGLDDPTTRFFAHVACGHMAFQCDLFQQAERHFRDARTLRPWSPRTTTNWAMALAAIGEGERARRVVESLDDHVVDRARTRVAWGFAAAGNIEKGIEFLEQRPASAGDSVSVLLELGRLRRLNRDHVGAMKAFTRAAKYEPNSPEVIRELTKVKLGELKGAATRSTTRDQINKAADRLEELDATDPHPYIFRGWLRLFHDDKIKTGDGTLQKVCEHLRAAIALDHHAGVGFVLSEIQRVFGVDPEEGDENLEEARELYPRSRSVLNAWAQHRLDRVANELPEVVDALGAQHRLDRVANELSEVVDALGASATWPDDGPDGAHLLGDGRLRPLDLSSDRFGLRYARSRLDDPTGVPEYCARRAHEFSYHRLDQRARSDHLLAMAALKRTDAETAERAMRRAVAALPKAAPYRERLAFVLEKRGKIRAAHHELEAACRLEPGSLGYAFRLAESEACLGRFDRALRILEALRDRVMALPRTRAPGAPFVFVRLGEMYRHRGRFEAALAAFDEAIKRWRRPSPYLADIVECRIELGRVDGLRAMIDKEFETLGREKKNKEREKEVPYEVEFLLLTAKARIARAEGTLDVEERLLRDAIQFAEDENDAELRDKATLRLVESLATRRPREAAEAIGMFVDEQPAIVVDRFSVAILRPLFDVSSRSPNWFLVLARRLVREDRLDEAVDVLRDGSARHPDSLTIMEELANRLVDAGRVREAWTVADAVGSFDFETRLARGRIALRIGRPDRVVKELADVATGRAASLSVRARVFAGQPVEPHLEKVAEPVEADLLGAIVALGVHDFETADRHARGLADRNDARGLALMAVVAAMRGGDDAARQSIREAREVAAGESSSVFVARLADLLGPEWAGWTREPRERATMTDAHLLGHPIDLTTEVAAEGDSLPNPAKCRVEARRLIRLGDEASMHEALRRLARELRLRSAKILAASGPEIVLRHVAEQRGALVDPGLRSLIDPPVEVSWHAKADSYFDDVRSHVEEWGKRFLDRER